MDREQALHDFWSRFGLKAYDENTIPDDAVLPYITYEVATGSFDENISLSASIWYRSESWKEITQKKEEIDTYIGYGGNYILFDSGAILISRGTPFSQRMSDDSSKDIRRVLLNINAEYLSA